MAGLVAGKTGDSEKSANVGQQKSPAANRGALFKYRDEDVPSLADLAATYSSKP